MHIYSPEPPSGFSEVDVLEMTQFLTNHPLILLTSFLIFGIPKYCTTIAPLPKHTSCKLYYFFGVVWRINFLIISENGHFCRLYTTFYQYSQNIISSFCDKCSGKQNLTHGNAHKEDDKSILVQAYRKNTSKRSVCFSNFLSNSCSCCGVIS